MLFSDLEERGPEVRRKVGEYVHVRLEHAHVRADSICFRVCVRSAVSVSGAVGVGVCERERERGSEREPARARTWAQVGRSAATERLLCFDSMRERRDLAMAFCALAARSAYVICPDLIRLVPSPTLSPTDPVPRGLLTLCPGAY